MKFDTDLILESFRPLKELAKMNEQVRYNKIEDKLEALIHLLRNTERGQGSAEDLNIKQKNFKFVTDFRDNFHKGRGLSKKDMLFCNKVWKRYK
jgi:hypothetical protein